MIWWHYNVEDIEKSSNINVPFNTLCHFVDDFYRPDDQTNNDKALKETSWSSRSGMNPTRTTPSCYSNTTLGNRLYIQRKGPNATNPICWTCENCSYECAADCEHCVTQCSTEQLIIFPLNLQTITITRMLSSGREGQKRTLTVSYFDHITASISNEHYLLCCYSRIRQWK